MTKTGQRIIQRQAGVDDRRTVSRGQGRDNKPGARARNQNTENLTRKTWKRFVCSGANNTRQSVRDSPGFM